MRRLDALVMSGVPSPPASPLRRAGRLAVLLAAALTAGGAARPEGATGESYPVGEVIDKVATANDPSQQYALYLPTGYGSDDRVWPILLVLDPRGRAVAGVERFLPAAERHGWVVSSSYQSRSDTLRDVNAAALDALLLDVQQRFRVDMRRLYLAGMSGTAHIAWRFAQLLGDHVAGVIAAGGGVQTSTQGPPGDATFAYYGIAGTADFNFQELMGLERHMLARGIDHRIEIFEGRHGWPPHEHTNRALDWMQLQAVRRRLAPDDPALVDAALERARLAAGEATDPLERLRRHRDVVRDFQGLRRVAEELEAVRALEADPEVDRRRRQESRLANAEQAHTGNRYARWVGELRDRERRPPSVRESLLALRIEPLKKRAADTDNPAEAHSAQRTLESLYVGVAFYHPRTFEREGDLERAVRSLEVAVAVFPERPRAHWWLAGAYARAGRRKAALNALRTATAFGNVDLERLRTDPTWEPLRASPGWDELIASLEAGLSPAG